MDRQSRVLPILAVLTGLAWMAGVLFVSAYPKELSPAGDLAYDRANRVHTLALVLLLATATVVYNMIRAGRLPGLRAARVLILGAGLLLVGNVVSFWGALVVGQQSDQFWGGLVGWLLYLPGELIVLGSFIGLARAGRHWPNVSRAQRWLVGSVGVLFSITTVTWAISPAATLVPAVLAAFALLATGTTIARTAAAAGSVGTTASAVSQ